MKYFFISVIALLGIGTVTPSFSQGTNKITAPQHGTQGIVHRMQHSMPIFSFTQCSNFLSPFGSSEATISSLAKKAGLRFVAKERIDIVPGSYALAFIDPDNVVTPQGELLTELVIYIFTFHPKLKYFAFTTRVQCVNTIYAKNVLSSISQNFDKLGADNIRLTGTSSLLCSDESSDANNRVRTFNLQREENAVTFTVMDYTAIQENVMELMKK
jgi:hypothetical protein